MLGPLQSFARSVASENVQMMVVYFDGFADIVQPYTNDAVSLWAYVTSLNGAKNWSVTSSTYSSRWSTSPSLPMPARAARNFLAGTRTVMVRSSAPVTRIDQASPSHSPDSSRI